MYCESNDHVYHICTERPLRTDEARARRHGGHSRHVEPRCVPLRVVIVDRSFVRARSRGVGVVCARGQSSDPLHDTRFTRVQLVSDPLPRSGTSNDGVARPPVPAREAVSHAPPVALFEKDGRPRRVGLLLMRVRVAGAGIRLADIAIPFAPVLMP